MFQRWDADPDIFEIVLASGMGVFRGIPAKNSACVGIDLNPHMAGAAPLNALALPALSVSLFFVFLSATSASARTDEKP